MDAYRDSTECPNLASEVRLNRAGGGNAPLVPVFRFKTDHPASAVFELSDGAERWSVEPSAKLRLEHVQPLVEFRPDASYTIGLRLKGANGFIGPVVETFEFKTPPLPDDFPPLKVLRNDPVRREPGYLIFNVTKPNDPHWPKIQNYRIALNARGEVVYFAKSRGGTPRVLANGRLLSFSRGMITELDFFGNVSQRWYTKIAQRKFNHAIEINWRGRLHHAFADAADGTFLAVSKERYPVTDYPSHETNPNAPIGDAIVIGDQIVEIDRDNGEVLRVHDLFKLLDPYRVCYGSVKPDPQVRFPNPKLRDWSHTNSLVHDPSDDSIVVSVRNQDSIVKIDRETGELVWILGPHENWRGPWTEKLLTPLGDLEWQYHQHDVSVTPHGTFFCFDNGNYRATPPAPKKPAPENYSRAVEFRVDRDAMTVEQVWAFGEENGRVPFAGRSGAVVHLPETDNVLINIGTISTDANGDYADNAGVHIHAHLMEINRSGGDEVVFEAVIDDESRELSHSIYRCIHVSNIYELEHNLPFDLTAEKPRIDRQVGRAMGARRQRRRERPAATRRPLAR